MLLKAYSKARSNIEDQYREGMVGRTGGFDVFENTMIPVHTTGTYGGTPLTNGATGFYWFRQCLCCNIFYRYRWLDKVAALA